MNIQELTDALDKKVGDFSIGRWDIHRGSLKHWVLRIEIDGRDSCTWHNADITKVMAQALEWKPLPGDKH